MESSKSVCEFCEKTYSSKQNLLKHIRYVHKIQNSNSSFFCKENGCTVQCNTSMKLRTHLAAAHKFHFEKSVIEFEKIDEFYKWKDAYEEKEDCNFAKSTGVKILKNGNQKYYFCCHRSGKVKSKENSSRISQASSKLGFSCTATITLTEKIDGKVVCELCPDHYGHSKEVGKLHLTKNEKSHLASRLSQKISEDDILKDIRNDFVSKEKLSRMHLTTKQDLKNIKQKFQLTEPTRHPDDATSVSLMVSDFERHGNNPIIAHKFQGKHGSGFLYELDINDVFFVVMHPLQKMIFEEFGKNTICIDSTHGTNRYGFILITILVIDEYEEGFPVAFCLCNREDSCSLKVFFSILKENLTCDISPKVFMSDDAPAFYNAWKAVFGPVQHKLLCAWHVERAIRSKLQSIIKDNDLLATVYKSIILLLEETNEEEFKRLYDGLIELLQNSNVKKFGDYFIKVYGNRMTEIAYCYRKNIGINTNMHLESFHRVFKYNFLKAKTNNRVDMCLYQITEYIKDKTMERVKKIERGKLTYKLRQISSRHKIAMKLDFALVEKKGEKYIVDSTTNGLKYEVMKSQCFCDCKAKCQICAFCIHEISCTCPDYTIRHILCKHCHLVLQKINLFETFEQHKCNEEMPGTTTVQLLKATEELFPTSSLDISTEPATKEKITDENPHITSISNENVKSLDIIDRNAEVNTIHQLLKEKKSNINECNNLLKTISDQISKLNPDVDNQTIKKACSMLYDVSNFLSASSSKCVNEMLPPANHENIKIKTQRSFYSTTKKKSVLKKNKLIKASCQEKESIRNEILNLGSDEGVNLDSNDHSYCLKQDTSSTDTRKSKLRVLTNSQHKLLKKIVNCELHSLFINNEHISPKLLKDIDHIPDNIIDDNLGLIKDLLSSECLKSLENIIERKKEMWCCSICSDSTTKKNMIECETCMKWMHFSCVGIEETTEILQWNCNFCKHKM